VVKVNNYQKFSWDDLISRTCSRLPKQQTRRFYGVGGSKLRWWPLRDETMQFVCSPIRSLAERCCDTSISRRESYPALIYSLFTSAAEMRDQDGGTCGGFWGWERVQPLIDTIDKSLAFVTTRSSAPELTEIVNLGPARVRFVRACLVLPLSNGNQNEKNIFPVSEVVNNHHWLIARINGSICMPSTCYADKTDRLRGNAGGNRNKSAPVQQRAKLSLGGFFGIMVTIQHLAIIHSRRCIILISPVFYAFSHHSLIGNYR
jgi:hypothetical protein